MNQQDTQKQLILIHMRYGNIFVLASHLIYLL